jgi:SAM-dependent methyltransferase
MRPPAERTTPTPVLEASDHYDDQYFVWQRSIGEFAGWADLPKFQPHLRETDAVVDFGCGGGYLLSRLRAADKIGVEPNPSARQVAQSHGFPVVASPDELADGLADVIISNHALEHVREPLRELERLRMKLKQGGLAVFVVPCEGARQRWRPDDVNHHLYSWCPMSIGNLFTEAGFTVQSSDPLIYRWTPISNRIAQYGGRRAFDLSCRIYGHLKRSLSQAKVVARR